MFPETWLVWAVLSAVFAALVTIFAKAGLRGIDPDFAQLVRTAVVLPALALLVLATGKWQGVAAWNARTWIYLVLSGLATGASWLCFFRALDVGSASRVAAVDKLSVVLVAVFAAVLLKERLGIVNWCGIAFVAIGLIMLSVMK
jgi:bacterial/archaeal transporter family protein